MISKDGATPSLAGSRIPQTRLWGRFRDDTRVRSYVSSVMKHAKAAELNSTLQQLTGLQQPQSRTAYPPYASRPQTTLSSFMEAATKAESWKDMLTRPPRSNNGGQTLPLPSRRDGIDGFLERGFGAMVFHHKAGYKVPQGLSKIASTAVEPILFFSKLLGIEKNSPSRTSKSQTFRPGRLAYELRPSTTVEDLSR